MNQKRQVIMLVDDDPANLAGGKCALQERYDVFTLESAEALFELIRKVMPDLILLNINLPGMNGYEAVTLLKRMVFTRNIPVILVTSINETENEPEGLSLGAVDYITRPFSPALLLKRIENNLLMEARRRSLEDYNGYVQQKVLEKTKEAAELQNSTLRAVAELVEFRDSVSGGHIDRTENYLQLMADHLWQEKIYWNDIADWNVDFLIASAALHDLGKIAVSDAILNKPGRLTAEEFEVMKEHTIFGERQITAMMNTTDSGGFLEHARVLAGCHHEKWDGTGYPRGLRKEAIPLQGRMMAVADVYDALTSDRPYRKAISCEVAERIIIEGRCTQFDPILIDVFRELAPDFAKIALAGRKEPPAGL
jgi:putative two-component system response regulator